MQQVILPTVRGMAEDGRPYTGFLYAGVMIDRQGVPRVLEYNVRFGDPETQPIMLRLRSDLVALCLAALERRLDEISVEWDPRASLGVVLAAAGYPADYATGDAIHGLDSEFGEGVKVFHAGTRLQDGAVVTNGGRVLCVCALGEDVAIAQRRAYAAVDAISWDNLYCRRDIGHRAIARL
jgi:phosphoribosylamine--glycine ligase